MFSGKVKQHKLFLRNCKLELQQNLLIWKIRNIWPAICDHGKTENSSTIWIELNQQLFNWWHQSEHYRGATLHHQDLLIEFTSDVVKWHRSSATSWAQSQASHVFPHMDTNDNLMAIINADVSNKAKAETTPHSLSLLLSYLVYNERRIYIQMRVVVFLASLKVCTCMYRKGICELLMCERIGVKANHPSKRWKSWNKSWWATTSIMWWAPVQRLIQIRKVHRMRGGGRLPGNNFFLLIGRSAAPAPLAYGLACRSPSLFSSSSLAFAKR